MKELTHFSLFTGIGGIDLAAEWAGFRTVGQCEYADYPTKVLEKHWPDVPRWRDIRSVKAEDIQNRGIGEITVLSGGFPCQPHSLAEPRLASDDERDLWDEFARIIREIKPKWVLGENVPGLLSSENGRFFGRILRDLAGMGYYAGWCCYPASWVGAVHRRERVFIVANSDSERCGRWIGQEANQKRAKVGAERKYLWNQTSNFIIQYLRDPATAPEDIRSNYGFPDWAHRLKGIGNAVSPPQAYPILAAIAEIEWEAR